MQENSDDYHCRQWELAFKLKDVEVIYLRKVVSILKLYCTFQYGKKRHISALHISEKDWMVLNPWLSGRGAFPGRMDIFTSSPEKQKQVINSEQNKCGTVSNIDTHVHAHHTKSFVPIQCHELGRAFFVLTWFLVYDNHYAFGVRMVDHAQCFVSSMYQNFDTKVWSLWLFPSSLCQAEMVLFIKLVPWHDKTITHH